MLKALKIAGFIVLTAAAIWGLYLSTILYGQERYLQGAKAMSEYCDTQETTLPKGAILDG